MCALVPQSNWVFVNLGQYVSKQQLDSLQHPRLPHICPSWPLSTQYISLELNLDSVAVKPKQKALQLSMRLMKYTTFLAFARRERDTAF